MFQHRGSSSYNISGQPLSLYTQMHQLRGSSESASKKNSIDTNNNGNKYLMTTNVTSSSSPGRNNISRTMKLRLKRKI